MLIQHVMMTSKQNKFGKLYSITSKIRKDVFITKTVATDKFDMT